MVETDIKDSLVDAHCLVTNMSLSAIDAVLNMTPVICHGKMYVHRLQVEI